MRVKLTTMVAVAALLGAGACSRNNDDLPPPPPPQEPTQTPTPTPPPPPVTDRVVPGSMEDFMQQVGSDRVFFAFDSSSLDAEARDTLSKQAAWLQQYGNVQITVEGHADERGTREYNLALGERRANAAAQYLAGQGVAASRISTISYGKERPAVEGSSESAYAQNRRAVTVLTSGTAS